MIDQIASTAGDVMSIIALTVMVIRPFRNKVFGIGKITDGIKCQLRHDMLHTYYTHKDSGVIRQYEYEDFEYQYKAYKALKGNSFVDKIHSEVEKWEVIS